jgi:adhesin/invasin
MAGTWTVTGTYESLNDTASLTVMPDPPTSIALTAEKETILAGENLSFIVTAYDDHGNEWDVSDEAGYSIEAAAEGTWDGNAYTAAKAGQWTVTASYAGHEAQFTLTVEPNVPAQLVLSAEPDILPADGESTAVITATVSDAWDNLVADGTRAEFYTTLGTLNTNTAPTKNGLATATLTSNFGGVAVVTVTVNGIEPKTIEIGFEVEAPENRIYLPLILRK